MSNYRFAKLFELGDPLNPHQVLYTMLPVDENTQAICEAGEMELVQMKVVCRVNDGTGRIMTHENTDVVAAWRAEQLFDEIDDETARRDLELAAHFFNPDECEV